MMSIDKRLLIFAGNRAQGDQYARQCKINLTKCRIVQYEDQVKGLQPADFDHVCVGTWMENREVFAAYKAWQQRVQVHTLQQKEAK